MKSQYPIKRLAKLNISLAIYFILLWFGISLATNGLQNMEIVVRNSVLGTLLLLANSFLNVALLVIFEDLSKTNKSKHKVLFIVSSFCLNLILYLVIAYIYIQIIHNEVQVVKFLYVGFISIMINTSSLVFQGLLVLHDLKSRVDLENSNLRAANSEAANQLLRQQIQPHFLFNALSTLKSLYRKNTESGETYLIHLSDFLRVVVSAHNTKVIPLKEEISLCEDYIEMQKIRFNEALRISFSISGKMIEKGFVPSFAIQTLIENAIKHNQLTEEIPLSINIRQEGDRIEVVNNLNLKSSSNSSSTGSGLLNLSERYRLIANDEIIIDQTESTFTVSIKIIE